MAIEGVLHRSFAVNLRRIRREKKLTQEAAASLLGLTQGAYSHMEVGRFTPTLDTVERVAAAFEVSYEELLSLEKIPEMA